MSMKIRLGDLRRIIREALEVGGDLGAVKRARDNSVTITLYRPSVLRGVVEVSGNLPKVGSSNPVVKGLIDGGGVVGHLKVFATRDDCGGAWELGEIWGPGFGRRLVDMAFGLSPTHKVVIDRSTVLPPGLDLWKRVTVGMKSEPLPPGCVTKHDDPVLNRIYSSSGDLSVLNAAVARHADLMDELSGTFDVAPRQMEDDVMDAGYAMFGESW
jgi:hypothetical protein